MSMSSIQGHYHSKFYISYWANPNGLFFDANAGTFADHQTGGTITTFGQDKSGELYFASDTGNIYQFIKK